MRLLRRCDSAVELAPQRAELRDELGTMLAQRNQFRRGGRQHSKKRSGCSRGWSRRIFILGVDSSAAAAPGRSGDELGKAVKLNPQDAAAHYYLAKNSHCSVEDR